MAAWLSEVYGRRSWLKDQIEKLQYGVTDYLTDAAVWNVDGADQGCRTSHLPTGWRAHASVDWSWAFVLTPLRSDEPGGLRLGLPGGS